MPIRSDFANSLPLSIKLCGWSVHLTNRSDGAVMLDLVESTGDIVKESPGDDHKWNVFQTDVVKAKREELTEFFQYFLALPIGPSLLTFGRIKWVNERRIADSPKHGHVEDWNTSF